MIIWRNVSFILGVRVTKFILMITYNFRILLKWDGYLWSEPEGPCSIFQACWWCSRCNPNRHNQRMRLCNCLPGFERDISGGCTKISSKCASSNTSFVKLIVTMVRSNTQVFIEVSEIHASQIAEKNVLAKPTLMVVIRWMPRR